MAMSLATESNNNTDTTHNNNATESLPDTGFTGH